MNLSLIEKRGLRWLQKNVLDEQICVCKADKGGAILLVPPEMLTEKIEEKVKNTDIYEELEADPREEIYDDMLDKWRKALNEGFVTEIEA